MVAAMAIAADKLALVLFLATAAAAIAAVQAGESAGLRRPPSVAAAAGTRFNSKIVVSLDLFKKL